jgi:hypothetical protein
VKSTLILLALTTLASLTAVPAAMAGVRWAGPGGSGTACTEAAPCSVTTAIQMAPDEPTEIILKPGDYPVTATIDGTQKPLDVHGQEGAPRPRLLGAINSNAVLRMSDPGARLSHVYIENLPASPTLPHQALFFGYGSGEGVVDRVVLRGAGPGTSVCQCYPERITNSVLRSDGPDAGAAIGLQSNGGTASVELRNVTLYSDSAAAGAIRLRQQGTMGSIVYDAFNVIAHAPSGPDIVVSASMAGGSATVNITRSNFADSDVVAGPGSEALNATPPNQSGLPLLADAPNGDYHQLPGSLTIDFGLLDAANGALDLDGNLRTMGPATDVGAYEQVVPPAVETGAAGSVTTSGAVLTGTAQSGDAAGAGASFEIGTTTSYGRVVAAGAVGRSATPESFSATVDGLAPGTTYHYRALATNSAGAGAGADRTFTTASAAAVEAPRFESASLLRTRFRVGRAPTPLSAGRRRAPRGSEFRFALSRAASVSIAIDRRSPGRRVGRRCRPPSRRLARRPRCSRWVRKGTLTRSGAAGANRVPFSGRLGRRALTPGAYRAVLTATADGLRSERRVLRFRIVP